MVSFVPKRKEANLLVLNSGPELPDVLIQFFKESWIIYHICP